MDVTSVLKLRKQIGALSPLFQDPAALNPRMIVKTSLWIHCSYIGKAQSRSEKPRINRLVSGLPFHFLAPGQLWWSASACYELHVRFL